jgi:hypothetical protein
MEPSERAAAVSELADVHVASADALGALDRGYVRAEDLEAALRHTDEVILKAKAARRRLRRAMPVEELAVRGWV